jgi:tetratricopeptide (TPR) repeat protein
MKTKCPKCGTGKARRRCAREGHAEICSECCASIRDADCGDCTHYAAARQYEDRSHVSARSSDGHFMMEISPEVQDAVNTALEIAQRGKTQMAMSTLTGLLHDHPLNHDVAFGIGVVHAIQGEHEESIQWFDKAIAIYPYSVEAYYNKAVAFQKLLDAPNCIRSYQKVVAIGSPDDPEVAKARAQVERMATAILKTEGIALDAYLRAGDKFNHAFELMQRGDWQGALRGFRASAAINDRNAPCHGNMGLCHAWMGHKAEALAELDRALEIDPKYQPARLNRQLVEQMEEGRPLAYKGQIINHALERFREQRK